MLRIRHVVHAHIPRAQSVARHQGHEAMRLSHALSLSLSPCSPFNQTLCMAAIFRLATTTDYANRKYFLADTDNANSLISFECNMPHAPLELVAMTNRSG